MRARLYLFPFLFRVLRGTGHADKGRVRNCTPFNHVHAGCHRPVDGIEKQRIQTVLQRATEVQQRCVARNILLQELFRFISFFVSMPLFI